MSVDPATLEVADGQVEHPPTKRTLGFARSPRAEARAHDRGRGQGDSGGSLDDRRRSATKVNAREIVTGRHRYTSDLGPGPFARRAAARQSAAAARDGRDARIDQQASIESLAGAVVVTDGDFVGIAARTPRGRRALSSRSGPVEPDPAAGRPRARQEASPGTEPQREGQREPRRRAYVVGSVADARANAAHRLEATYRRLHRPRPARAAPRWRSGRTAVSPSGPGPSVPSA